MITFIIFLIIYVIIVELEFKRKINFHKVLHPKKYNILTLEEYDNKNSTSGKNIAKNSRIAICSLGRNISKSFSSNSKNFEYIGEQFGDYKIVFFENDSVDNSRDLLTNWATENKNVVLLDCCNLGSCDCKLKTKKGYDIGWNSTERMSAMSDYRNKYLNYVKNNLPDYDYMLVVDFDLDGAASIEGIYDSLYQTDWDAIFCNGKFPIPGTFGLVLMTYDALAFVDINKDYKVKITNYELLKNYITINGKKDINMMPVKSAFNGCGLYKVNSIKNCSYDGNLSCEHANLAKQIYDGNGKLYINKNWSGYFGIQGPETITAYLF